VAEHEKRDPHLEESRRLLEEMEAMLRRVRSLVDDRSNSAKPKNPGDSKT